MPNKNKIETTTFPSPQWPGGEEQPEPPAALRPLASEALMTGQAVYTGSGKCGDGGAVSLGDFGLQYLPAEFSKAIGERLRRKLRS